jgi:uncharacterized protein (TIGR02145 family)
MQGTLKTVNINGKDWTVSNLDKRVFNTGDSILEVKSQYEWALAIQNKQPAYCVYPNSNGKYGLLYNSFAVVDMRGLAPDGYRVATNEDWQELVKLHSDSTAYCLRSNDGYFIGKNLYGFNALAGGFRSHVDDYSMYWGHDYMTAWFTSSGGLVYMYADIQALDLSFVGYGGRQFNPHGAYIRCIKEQ